MSVKQQIATRHTTVLKVHLERFHALLEHLIQTLMVKVSTTVQCALLGSTVWNNPLMRLETVAPASTVQQTSQTVCQACALVPMGLSRCPVLREPT